MARPTDRDELAWLRQQGIQLIVSLSEDRLRRDWVNDIGLLALHEPVEDMEAPTQEQLERIIAAIRRAHEKQIPVVVHCTAGMGRTGVVLACYFIAKGTTAQDAIAKVRRLRPGSIETEEQADAVVAFARQRGGSSE